MLWNMVKKGKWSAAEIHLGDEGRPRACADRRRDEVQGLSCKTRGKGRQSAPPVTCTVVTLTWPCRISSQCAERSVQGPVRWNMAFWVKKEGEAKGRDPLQPAPVRLRYQLWRCGSSRVWCICRQAYLNASIPCDHTGTSTEQALRPHSQSQGTRADCTHVVDGGAGVCMFLDEHLGHESRVVPGCVVQRRSALRSQSDTRVTPSTRLSGLTGRTASIAGTRLSGTCDAIKQDGDTATMKQAYMKSRNACHKYIL